MKRGLRDRGQAGLRDALNAMTPADESPLRTVA
jgi:hypothetical protein